jgi:hypothetical protein
MGSIPETDLAYAAAILDGEGSIIIQHYKQDRWKNGNIYNVYGLRVTVSMVSDKIPLWLKERFGGNIQFRKKPNDRWKDQHCWCIYASNAGKFLELVMPYVLLKVEQAKLGILFTSEKGKRDNAWRADIRQQMRLLNKTGKSVETNTLNDSETELKIESELAGDCKSEPEMSLPA